MDYKSTPHATKEIIDRTVIGIAAVHGNVDEGGDRSHPGSFADTKVDGRDRARFLWQHNAQEPPIATINYVREISRNQLPPKVLEYAPDATGGVEISRTYLDTPRGNEVLTGIKAGAIQEMSYAYDLTNYAFTETDTGTIREIYGVKLFDMSDVTWGMNPATLAVKRADWKDRPLTAHAEAVEAALKELVARTQEVADRRAKEGRVLSDANRTKVASALDALDAARAALQALLDMSKVAPEPEQADIRRLFAQYQRNLAIINGASI